MASLGRYLREQREARNISIVEIASVTKIVSRYLEALENDRLDLMPGGFFIKGIIRTYARAIGLDEEEVLARYKAAGLIGEPGDKRRSYDSPAPGLPSESAPVFPSEAWSPPAEPVPSSTPEEPSGRVIEEAPEPKLSPARRKAILGWAFRGAAAVLVIAALVVFWPSRRPRPSPAEPKAAGPEIVVAQAVLPPPQKTEPGSELPSTLLSEEELEPEPAPSPGRPPAADEFTKGVTIEFSFYASTYVQVHADGVIRIEGVFTPGSSARARADNELRVHVGNAGGFTYLLNGKPAKPLGRIGQVLTNVRITPENYKEFLESQAPGPPAG